MLYYDPFRELDRVSQQFFGRARPAGMPMDAYRRGEHFFVNLDLPGVDPESIELTVEQNALTVKAERSWQPAEGDEVLVSERPQGSFSRQLMLGDNLDTEKMEAHYDQGVLRLSIPVAEAARPRRVAVTSGARHTEIGTQRAS